jgi:D-alanyl-D-alanine-carboxypeptidase/D-alanyl-D-alanine-endopeptidase
MVTFFSLSLCNSGHCTAPISSINTHYFLHSLHGCFSLKRCLLSFAALCGELLRPGSPTADGPVLASDIADRYANLIYYGSGATGMAMVVIDGNQRVFAALAKRARAITFTRSWIPLSASPP